MKKPHPALVLTDSAVIAMEFARSLARKGIDVYGAMPSWNAAVFSKYLKECFISPKIENDTKALIEFLREFHKEHPSSVIVPGSDNLVLRLAYAIEEMDKETRDHFCFIIAGKEVVEKLVDKRKFYSVLSKQNIPYPPTYFPENREDAARISREVQYPAYIKPSMAQDFQRKFLKKGFVVESKKALMRDYDLSERHKLDVLIQEIIPGEDNQVFGINAYFSKQHVPISLFAYRRLRGSPQSFGVGCLIESIPLSSAPSVSALGDFLRKIDYTGFVDAEFKLDPRDGKFKFLEVNPRLWLQNSFPAYCGTNLNLIAYLDAIGVHHTQPLINQEYDVGAKWLYPSYDLPSVIKMFLNGQLSFREWIHSLHGVRDRAFSPAADFFPCIMNPFINSHFCAKRHDSIKLIASNFLAAAMSLPY